MKDAVGNTALHRAAECNQPSACRFLIANGADPLIKNCEDHVPADLATPAVAKVITEEPVKANADIESQLLDAAKNGDLDTLKVHVLMCVLENVHVCTYYVYEYVNMYCMCVVSVMLHIILYDICMCSAEVLARLGSGAFPLGRFTLSREFDISFEIPPHPCSGIVQ